MKGMTSRIFPIMRKEFTQILRDPHTLAVMFLIPVVQLILLGYAASTNVEHLATAVLDKNRTPESRALIEAYRASNYFDIAFYVSSENELARLIDSGQARAGLLIPPDYSDKIARDEVAQVGFVIDGSDPNVANTALSAAQAIGQTQSAEIVQRMLERHGIELRQAGLDVRPRVWYNPELSSANFMIPGLMASILQILTTFLTAMAIVRERERGTIEQLIVTPLKPYELILGKMIPYIFIAFWDTIEVLLIGMFWFQVPMHGSVILLFALSAIALLTSLGLGLFISTISKTQQEAMLLTYFTMLPSIFLSGFIFPIAAMPKVLQYVSYFIPLTYFLVIVRGIVLKGIGLELLPEQIIALTVFGVAILTLAALQFRKRLE
jgi:ABC-2 type transport system permease protein